MDLEAAFCIVWDGYFLLYITALIASKISKTIEAFQSTAVYCY